MNSSNIMYQEITGIQPESFIHSAITLIFIMMIVCIIMYYFNNGFYRMVNELLQGDKK